MEPGSAANGYKRAGWIVAEIFQQCGHERERIWKFIFKKTTDLVVARYRGEATLPFELPEEGASERAVRIRQRDHHEGFAWPDMKRIGFHAPRTVRRRRNGEFFVAMGEIAFLVLKRYQLFLHRSAHSRESAIDTDDGVAGSKESFRGGGIKKLSSSGV